MRLSQKLFTAEEIKSRNSVIPCGRDQTSLALLYFSAPVLTAHLSRRRWLYEGGLPCWLVIRCTHTSLSRLRASTGRDS